ncbi:MAG: hypothetical protein H6755_02605 [Candidatus Omnitrophica bacterium]|nr:hypothetical protein [Candidatus Omnitrophota bacterium]
MSEANLRGKLEGEEMKDVTIIFRIFCLIFILNLTNGALAEPMGGTPADFLVEVGIEHYKNDQIEYAIQEFSKALMLDPRNEEARYYLNEMGLKDGLYDVSRTRVTEIAGLSYQILDFKDQVQELEGEKQLMGNKINELAQENMNLASTVYSKEIELDILKDRGDYYERMADNLRKNKSGQFVYVKGNGLSHLKEEFRQKYPLAARSISAKTSMDNAQYMMSEYGTHYDDDRDAPVLELNFLEQDYNYNFNDEGVNELFAKARQDKVLLQKIDELINLYDIKLELLNPGKVFEGQAELLDELEKDIVLANNFINKEMSQRGYLVE